jgi:hypothetical protein
MKSVRSQLAEVAQRKERLIALAGIQRVVLASCVHGLRGPIGVADRGLEIVRFLRVHRLVVSAGLAAGAALFGRNRGLTGLAGRALALWRVWRSLSA